MNEVTSAMIESCDTAIKIAFTLIGIMAFWLGIMRIAEKSGLIKIISKLIYPIAKLLFSDIKKDSPALGDITMSLSANALGLTNAATPIGLKVMKELQEEYLLVQDLTVLMIKNLSLFHPTKTIIIPG